MLYDNMPNQNRKTKLTFVETWLARARSNGSINHIDNSEIRNKIESLMCAALKREPIKAWRISSASAKGSRGTYVITIAKNHSRVVIIPNYDRTRRIEDELLYLQKGDLAQLIGVLRHIVDAESDYCDRHREIDEAINLAYEAVLVDTI